MPPQVRHVTFLSAPTVPREVDALGYTIFKLHRVDGSCKIQAVQFEVSDIAGGVASLTYYLHAKVVTNLDNASPPVSTAKKYTMPATKAIVVDITDVTKGNIDDNIDRHFVEYESLGELAEIHVIANAGSCKIIPHLITAVL